MLFDELSTGNIFNSET